MYSFPLPLLGERVEGFFLSYTRKYQTCCSLEEVVGLALTLEPLNRVDALPPTFFESCSERVVCLRVLAPFARTRSWSGGLRYRGHMGLDLYTFSSSTGLAVRTVSLQVTFFTT